VTRLLAPQVSVVDNTTSLAIGEDSSAVDRFEAIKKLKSKGYIRFGCYAQTDASTDQALDKAPAIFLVFKAPNEANRTTIDAALAIRPRFANAAITILSVSDNRGWISAVLKARDYECNGFSVDRPAGPQ
jgi:hypothetical protein